MQGGNELYEAGMREVSGFNARSCKRYIGSRTILYYLGYRRTEIVEPHFEPVGGSYELFKENPLFGVGWTRQYEVNEHNHYIQQTVIYGVISSFIYIIFLAIMVSKIFGVLRKTLRCKSSGVSLSVLLFALTIAYLTYLNATPGESPYCWILFGLNVAWTKYSYDKQGGELNDKK